MTGPDRPEPSDTDELASASLDASLDVSGARRAPRTAATAADTTGTGRVEEMARARELLRSAELGGDPDEATLTRMVAVALAAADGEPGGTAASAPTAGPPAGTAPRRPPSSALWPALAAAAIVLVVGLGLWVGTQRGSGDENATSGATDTTTHGESKSEHSTADSPATSTADSGEGAGSPTDAAAGATSTAVPTTAPPTTAPPTTVAPEGPLTPSGQVGSVSRSILIGIQRVARLSTHPSGSPP